MEKARRFLTSAGILSCFLALSGCAGFGPPQTVIVRDSGSGGVQTATQPVPRVQDCAVLQVGSPSRFACNGKIYTSFQLAKLREDQAKGYAAGR